MIDASHRPYPAPRLPWLMAMRWSELAFLHWPVSAELLRPLIPEALEVDTFDGTAWIGVVPFYMSGVRPRCVPALPGLSAFPELNVRTYVSAGGKPGVWFFSLEAANRVAVRTARLTFGLPYFDARMSLAPVGAGIRYQSLRTHRHAPPAEFRGRYQPLGEPYRTRPGDLDYWLTERYCLYTVARGGRVCRGEIVHAPWPLQPAAVEIEVNTMTAPLGITLPPTPPVVHFARSLDVVSWAPKPI